MIMFRSKSTQTCKKVFVTFAKKDVKLKMNVYAYNHNLLEVPKNKKFPKSISCQTESSSKLKIL